ncbi:MAG TPA: cytochrome c-type biogenesis protein [Rudaea sp.]|nr:cytochrome c-type biogenesis protein [Rudaea sp.]
MKRIITALLSIVLLGAILTPPAYAIDALPFKDRAQELRFQQLTKQLRCMVCQNESLADSTASLAQDLRRDIFNQMQAGKSDAEIKQWLTSRYSDFVLYDPPLRPSTWLLWFSPLLLVLIGAMVLWRILRRRAQQPLPTTDSGEDW